MPQITKSFKPKEEFADYSLPSIAEDGSQKSESHYPTRDVATEKVSGILDIMPEGHGFLRPKYIPSNMDVYISASQIRRFNLRGGDYVEGGARQPKENERYFGGLA